MELEPKGGVLETTENENRPRFIIRAHHMNDLRSALDGSMSPGDMADIMITRLEMIREAYTIIIGKSRGKGWYTKDLLGNTQEQSDKWRRNYTEFLEEFLSLPDDYPVKIVQDQKDKVCEGCARGGHCKERPIPDDEFYITLFMNKARESNLENNLRVIEEIATYSSAQPRKVQTILTTAGIAKTIISEFHLRH